MEDGTPQQVYDVRTYNDMLKRKTTFVLFQDYHNDNLSNANFIMSLFNSIIYNKLYNKMKYA